ncbi:MAG: nicotinate phosphoribosyltransferase, partial [Acholeplasmataceae bacterium]
VFGGVFKLTAMEEDGKIVPKIKISENVQKTTIPGFKQVYRMMDQNNKAIADVITLHDEVIDESKPYRLFDPLFPWKDKIIENYKAVPLLTKIFDKGTLIYKKPNLSEIRKHSQTNLQTLWEEVLRQENPHQYYVDLSQKLYDLRRKMINEERK